MLAILHVLPGTAGQARASASNGASTGQSSPILAGPCLVNDDTALGMVPAAGASSHYRRSLADHSSLACSRVGTRHALCDTNAVRWNVAIKRVLTRSLDLCRRSSCCVRACMHPNTKFTSSTAVGRQSFQILNLVLSKVCFYTAVRGTRVLNLVLNTAVHT
jgi:hypothetical protein